MSGRWRAARWGLAAIRRVHRWRPRTHPQVWFYAVTSGLVLTGLVRIAGNRSSVLVAAVGTTLYICCIGGAESYRLSRRRDAAAVADWVATRPRLRRD